MVVEQRRCHDFNFRLDSTQPEIIPGSLHGGQSIRTSVVGGAPGYRAEREIADYPAFWSVQERDCCKGEAISRSSGTAS